MASPAYRRDFRSPNPQSIRLYQNALRSTVPEIGLEDQIQETLIFGSCRSL